MEPQDNIPPTDVSPDQQIQWVQVDINFLNTIVDYLKTKPYNEVHVFLDILLGKNQK
jgi:hypothetical protein